MLRWTTRILQGLCRRSQAVQVQSTGCVPYLRSVASPSPDMLAWASKGEPAWETAGETIGSADEVGGRVMDALVMDSFLLAPPVNTASSLASRLPVRQGLAGSPLLSQGAQPGLVWHSPGPSRRSQAVHWLCKQGVIETTEPHAICQLPPAQTSAFDCRSSCVTAKCCALPLMHLSSELCMGGR